MLVCVLNLELEDRTRNPERLSSSPRPKPPGGPSWDPESLHPLLLGLVSYKEVSEKLTPSGDGEIVLFLEYFRSLAQIHEQEPGNAELCKEP